MGFNISVSVFVGPGGESKQDESGGSRWQRACSENWRRRGETQGGQ